MNIEGISALVTGGASGLGFAAARELARRGVRVVICDLPASGGIGRRSKSAIAPGS